MFREIVCAVEIDRYFGQGHGRGPVLLEAGVIFLQVVIARLICRVLGHQMIDQSVAGPESGSVDLCCTRCGWGYHQTLY